MFISDNFEFNKLVNDIISETYSEEFLTKRDYYVKSVGSYRWLKEFGTYHFKFGRQKGTSTFCLKILDDYDSFLFVRNKSMTIHKRNLIRDGYLINMDGDWIYNFKNKKCNEVFCIEDLNRLRGITFPDIIIIDDYSEIKNEIIEELYFFISHNVKLVLCFG